MTFEKYFQEFERAAKRSLTSALWDKVFDRAEGFARDLYKEPGVFDDPAEAAEEFVEMVKELEAEGAFNESAAEPWSIEYKNIYSDKEVETFATEAEAWVRYNELVARTHGDMSDILWVEEPQGPANEDGSSAASLGVAPTGVCKKADESSVDDFLYNSLDDASLCDGRVIVKFCTDAGKFELVARLDDGFIVTLKSGPLFAVVDFYRDLLDWEDDEVLRYIHQEL